MALSLNDLFPATFRGVPFLASQVITTAGVKMIDHEYPNSPIRFMQDMGRLKSTFRITGHISGDNYIVNKIALKAALEDGSIGLLTHPFDGAFFVAPAEPYTLTESTRTLGEAVFEMVFKICDPPVNPSDSGSLISKIIGIADSLDNQLQSAFSAIFRVESFFPATFAAAIAKFGTISSEFNGFKSLGSSGGNTSDLVTQQKTFSSSIAANIPKPAVMVASISDLFALANDVGTDPGATGAAMQSLFDFGKNDAHIITTSVTFGTPIEEGVQRANNNAIINYTFVCYALLYAYLNYSQATFTDNVQLQTISDQLEAQYLKIINGQVTDAQHINVITLLSNDALDSLEQMRNLVRQQLNDDIANISRVITINTNPLSPTLLSYQYYGDTDQDQTIIDLNDTVDISFMSGAVNIITDPGMATS